MVTGGARGIGFATAQALLARGARVVIGDRDQAALDAAITELGRAGVLSGHLLDVSDRDSFAAFLDMARVDGGGRIDVLINNAGVMPVGSFVDQSQRAIRSSIEVNLYGVLNGCQLVLPEMVARRSGHIVNIASMAGVMALPGQVVYSATKYGVVGLSVAMADEFALPRCRSHGSDAALHADRPDRRDQLVRGGQTDCARSGGRRHRRSIGQAAHPGGRAATDSFGRSDGVDAWAARTTLVQQKNRRR